MSDPGRSPRKFKLLLLHSNPHYFNPCWPKLFCMLMDFSGLSRISLPSYGDLNLTPSSVTSESSTSDTIWNPPLSCEQRKQDSDTVHLLPAVLLWINLPETPHSQLKDFSSSSWTHVNHWPYQLNQAPVMQQSLNGRGDVFIHPIELIIMWNLLTGLMPRWYVFPRQIWHPRPSSWSTVIPLRVPCVPTGMKTGVLTAEWGSITSQALAFVTGHSATIRRVSGEAADRAFFMDMLFSKVLVRESHSVEAAMFQWPCDLNALILTAVVANSHSVICCPWRTRLSYIQS